MTSILQYTGKKWEEVIDFNTLRGETGKVGPMGPAGRDADMSFAYDVAEKAISSHESRFDHKLIDPFLVGSKTVSEVGMGDGMVLTYDGKGDKLVYTTLKSVATKVKQLAGRGLSLPSQSGHAGKFLTTDGSHSSWATVSGSGDVVGPAGAVANNFATFDGVTGKLIKDSGLNSSSFAAPLGADDNYVTDAEKTVIGNTSGTNTGDQLVFKTIAVAGQSNVVADTTTDTLTLVAGTNITITTDASTDSITINGGAGGSGITRSINSISTPTTAGATASTDYVYLISAGTTLTMPTAVGNLNRYSLKNVDTSDVTIAFTGGETADGSGSLTLRQYVAVDLISDNTNWNVI